MAALRLDEQAIFEVARKIDSREVREAYLQQVCGDDAALGQRVRALLGAYDKSTSFLEAPAARLVATVDAPIHERPGTVLGAYKLMEQIGEGGMGLVFVAEQQHPVRRKVAIKVIKPGMDTREVIARFEAERQALALMDHPHIARVFDAGATESGRPYFVMELVRGVGITQFCDANRLTPRERLELFVHVCQAVQHAHQKGIIHRDLKSTNILVTLHDGTPVVKVIDFGVAKAIGQQLTDKTIYTRFAQMIGTPMYLSPEQAEMSGLDVDTRTDVYALGVLLYELLTGTTPFEKERLQTAAFDEVRRLIREEEPPRPSTRFSTPGQATVTVSANRKSDPKGLSQLFRGELDWIVMKALEKDRNRRYESASAFAADVQRYLHNEQVLACPPTALYRFRKFARRNKVALVLASVAALAVLLVVGVVAGGLGWMARDRSVRQAKLNLEVQHALEEATKARDQALTLTDNPYRWKAALAEAVSELKRAQGLAGQDEAAVDPAIRERLEGLQALLTADETDRRFAARLEEIRLGQAEANVAISEFKAEGAFTPLQEAFQRHYQIAFGVTPVGQAVTTLQQRPKPMQDLFLVALEYSLEFVPKDDQQGRAWLAAVLDAADVGPWRKRARQANQASDWKALEQVVEEAVTARQPPSVLLSLIGKTPWDSPILLKLARRIRQAYPGDFWANHFLANYLQYGPRPRLEEAIHYYTAALALRPHNPIELVNLGDVLRDRGDLDEAVNAYREALDVHPDYAKAHDELSRALEIKGDLDGAITEQRQAIRFRKYARDHVFLGDLLARKGLLDEAVASYRNAIACYRAAIELNPRDGRPHNNLAWMLVTCPHVPFRDPAEGVKLARKAVELKPSDGSYWNTLGVAHYRAGEWRDAVATLEKSRELLRGQSDSYNTFFLAMAHWQLDEKEKARQRFDQAVQWMDKNNKPDSKELGRFRTEAAELLKVEPKKN